MNLMPKNAKNANSYECKFCDFICSKKSNWNIHLSTRKHNIRTTLNEIEPNHAKKCPNLFTCDCGKGYPARNSLWYHKKKCSFVQKDTEEDTKEESLWVR
jgi:acetone carboxylase gamma subunit